jgi:hypothetical protein
MYFISNLVRSLVNPLKAELNPIRHLLALVGAHHFVDVSRRRVKEEVLWFAVYSCF